MCPFDITGGVERGGRANDIEVCGQHNGLTAEAQETMEGSLPPRPRRLQRCETG